MHSNPNFGNDNPKAGIPLNNPEIRKKKLENIGVLELYWLLDYIGNIYRSLDSVKCKIYCKIVPVCAGAYIYVK